MTEICGYSFEEYIKKVVDFHGTAAPGLIIGGYMVDLAIKELPKGEFYDVICESVKCLPDAIQILTPCSIGNGWLKIEKVGRFAMTFYNKYTGEGIRLYLDTDKLEKFPPIKEWFLKLKPKDEQDSDKLFASIRKASSDIISVQKVKVDIPKEKKKKGGKITLCSVCNESYPGKEGSDKCKVCSGEINYYSRVK
ncbi:TPA: tRNA CCA-pyrophosphorylase [Candidatus Delongbacteria bacterium]|nr:tRNA CCA-pyrophosphorylase [Candidatus Delongbacteria bacterium]